MLKDFLKEEFQIEENDELILFFSKEKFTVHTFLKLIENNGNEEKYIHDILIWQLKDRFSVLAYLGAVAKRIELENKSLQGA